MSTTENGGPSVLRAAPGGFTTGEVPVDTGNEDHEGGANAKQVGGGHYKDVAYQHWDLCWDLRLQHLPAAITKYVTRHKKKDGRQGLEKAVHYAQKYQEVIVAYEVPAPRAFDQFNDDGRAMSQFSPQAAAFVQRQVLLYCRANNLDAEETLIVSLLCNPHDDRAVAEVEQLLKVIIAADYGDGADKTLLPKVVPHYPPAEDHTGEEDYLRPREPWPFPPRTGGRG